MLSGPGCASVTLLNFKTEKVPTADAEHPAIEILAIWQAAEGPGPKGIPVRGFAGQIFFFTQDRAAPVAVDGTARIYIFDDHGTVEEQARPLHQYDFDRGSWAAHLQSSKLGPTYGVFVPYPRNDYHQAICSLRVRFSAPKNRPLYSASSTIALPGPPLNPETAIPTVQASPLDGLTKKLQARPQQAARPWQNPTLGTGPKPFNTDPQMSAVQPQVGATRVNPIIQASATTNAGKPGAPAEASAYAENAVGYTDLNPQGTVQPSGRIKLQSAVTHANWLSDSEGSGNADGQRSPDVQPAQSLAHPNHPLAD
jgi:hypothetical protein